MTPTVHLILFTTQCFNLVTGNILTSFTTTAYSIYLISSGVIYDLFDDLLINNLIHHLETFHCLLLRDANELLFKGHWPEAVVEEEQTLGRINPEESGHVLVVW